MEEAIVSAGTPPRITGLKIGHVTDDAALTGVTVLLTECGATAAVDVRGSAPGTRETDLLAPTRLIQQVHGLVLAGGSAYGLAAADGVMRYLEHKGVGFPTPGGLVPIVPGAVIYDLAVGDGRVRPDEAMGYEAARRAREDEDSRGNVGAGTGATIGKGRGMAAVCRGGLGLATASLGPDGGAMLAIAVVNAFGDIRDPATGRWIAGARDPVTGLFQHTTPGSEPMNPFGSTTLVAIVTDLTLSRVDLMKIAEMAQDGLARAVDPAHTMYDGDLVFALATRAIARGADVTRLGALAAHLTTAAILDGVLAARSLPGLPAAADLIQQNRRQQQQQQ